MTGSNWRAIYYAYPCDTCGAEPGDPCTTTSGLRADIPHAARTALADRCPRCGSVLLPEQGRGDLCDRCALVRSLEIERATVYRRERP